MDRCVRGSWIQLEGGLDTTKFVLIKVSLGVGMHGTFLLGQ